MATITIEIPDATAKRFTDSIGFPNAETNLTAKAFAKNWLINVIKNQIKSIESRIASEQALNELTDVTDIT